MYFSWDLLWLRARQLQVGQTGAGSHTGDCMSSCLAAQKNCV